jgi:hypothetical protein
MERKHLEKQSIGRLRALLLRVAPDVQVIGRGITRKYLINRLIALCPPTVTARSGSGRTERRKKQYLIWTTQLAVLCRTPYLLLTSEQKGLITQCFTALYNDYCRRLQSSRILSPALFLYSLYSTMDGDNLWSPAGGSNSLLYCVDELRAAVNGADVHISDDRLVGTLFWVGPVACISDIVGREISKKVRSLHHANYERRRDALLAIGTKSVCEAKSIMKDLYNAYDELQLPGSVRHNYDTFLTQFARLKLGAGVRLEYLLASLPPSVEAVSSEQLIALYGDHAYDCEFLGINAIPSAAKNYYLIYLTNNQGLMIKIVGLYSKWKSLVRYLSEQYPTIVPVKISTEHKYSLPDDLGILVISSVTSY